MTLLRWPKIKLYTFILSMPFIVAMLHLIMYRERAWKELDIWIISTPIITAIGIIDMWGHVQYTSWVEQKYPLRTQLLQRITLKLLVWLFVMTPGVILILLLYDYFHILGYKISTDDMLKAMLVGACVNLIFETLYEADFMMQKNREIQAENKRLKILSVNEELTMLKHQVNPHFLFNCFNTLSSLITVDRQLAEKFLDELSKVYRYLLRSNTSSVSSLENELQFIDSYFSLLSTRYGESIKMNIRVDKHYLNYCIPTLSLQLLVENAVKHNQISKPQPLCIDIFTTADDNLVVSNSLRRKSSQVPGGGLGLHNIRSKYALLHHKSLQILESKSDFVVVLPLLWRPDANADTVHA